MSQISKYKRLLRKPQMHSSFYQTLTRSIGRLNWGMHPVTPLPQIAKPVHKGDSYRPVSTLSIVEYNTHNLQVCISGSRDGHSTFYNYSFASGLLKERAI